MRIYKEIDASDLTDVLWSGALDTIEDLTEDECQKVLDIYESSLELDADGEPVAIDETELNDFFWFERDLIAEWLGYDSFDDIMNR